MPCDEYGRALNFVVSCPSVIKRETYGQLIEPLMNNYLVENEIYTCNNGIDESNGEFIGQLHKQEPVEMFASCTNVDYEVQKEILLK